jgi:DNA replicative helicase MCM subunit Mcm2 (Cdc46/Mcm family)
VEGTVYSATVPSFTQDVNLSGTPAPDDDVPIAGDSELIYIEQIHTMREYQLTTLYVDYGHLLQKDDVLADAIQKQYYRFLPYLRKALHNLVAEYEPEYLKINPTSAAMDSTNLQSREFSVAFYHLPLVSAIRDLRTDKIGTLMSISGTVTRTSEVRPELLFGSFICEVCSALVHEIEQQFKYTEVRFRYLSTLNLNRLTDTVILRPAQFMPKSHLRKSFSMAAPNRYFQVHRLAKSSYPRESIRNSDRINAPVSGRHSSFRTR